MDLRGFSTGRLECVLEDSGRTAARREKRKLIRNIRLSRLMTSLSAAQRESFSKPRNWGDRAGPESPSVVVLCAAWGMGTCAVLGSRGFDEPGRHVWKPPLTLKTNYARDGCWKRSLVICLQSRTVIFFKCGSSALVHAFSVRFYTSKFNHLENYLGKNWSTRR